MDLFSVRIESDRLALVPLEDRWAAEVFLHFDAGVTRYMSPKPADTLDETLGFIRYARDGLAAGDNLQLVILDRTSGEFLGCAGLHRIGAPEPELGVWIKRPAHGRGYGREAVHALVGWARAHLEFEAFLYPVDRRNAPSRKIPESLGGLVVREFRGTGQAGQDLDEVEYRIPR